METYIVPQGSILSPDGISTRFTTMKLARKFFDSVPQDSILGPFP